MDIQNEKKIDLKITNADAEAYEVKENSYSCAQSWLKKEGECGGDEVEEKTEKESYDTFYDDYEDENKIKVGFTIPDGKVCKFDEESLPSSPGLFKSQNESGIDEIEETKENEAEYDDEEHEQKIGSGLKTVNDHVSGVGQESPRFVGNLLEKLVENETEDDDEDDSDDEKKIKVEFTTANGKVCQVNAGNLRSAENWLKMQNKYGFLGDIDEYDPDDEKKEDDGDNFDGQKEQNEDGTNEEKYVKVDFATASGKVCEVKEESLRSSQSWLKKQNESSVIEVEETKDVEDDSDDGVLVKVGFTTANDKVCYVSKDSFRSAMSWLEKQNDKSAIEVEEPVKEEVDFDEEKNVEVDFTTANGKVCQVKEECLRSSQNWLKKQNETPIVEETTKQEDHDDFYDDFDCPPVDTSEKEHFTPKRSIVISDRRFTTPTSSVKSAEAFDQRFTTPTSSTGLIRRLTTPTSSNGLVKRLTTPTSNVIDRRFITPTSTMTKLIVNSEQRLLKEENRQKELEVKRRRSLGSATFCSSPTVVQSMKRSPDTPIDFLSKRSR